jgi:hypothetical protein
VAVGAVVPRAPGLIWVRGLVAGDVMVDRSIRGDRLRPLGLFRNAARGRVSQHLREPAGRLGVIGDLVGLAEAIAGETVLTQVTGSRAAGPSSRRLWKQRRASLRAMVMVALVWESPRALSWW